jgi:uncharacterized protein (DUF302 family)
MHAKQEYLNVTHPCRVILYAMARHLVWISVSMQTKQPISIYIAKVKMLARDNQLSIAE